MESKAQNIFIIRCNSRSYYTLALVRILLEMRVAISSYNSQIENLHRHILISSSSIPSPTRAPLCRQG